MWSTGATTQSITVTSSGNYTVTVGSGSCIATSIGTSVTVHPLPNVTFGSLATMCTYTPAMTLTQGNPVGGSYTGNGVSSGMFDPAVAGLGMTTLVYTYIDGNGCMNSATSDVMVDECASVNETAENMISIYPNPSSGLITINAGNAMIESVKLFDYAGRLVYEVNDLQSNSISTDLSEFSNGVYRLEIMIENGYSHQTLLLTD
jgi:hypothetical protein